MGIPVIRERGSGDSDVIGMDLSASCLPDMTADFASSEPAGRKVTSSVIVGVNLRSTVTSRTYL